MITIACAGPAVPTSPGEGICAFLHRICAGLELDEHIVGFDSFDINAGVRAPDEDIAKDDTGDQSAV